MRCTRSLQRASNVYHSKPYTGGSSWSNEMKRWIWLHQCKCPHGTVPPAESGFTFQRSPGKATVCLARNHGPGTLYCSSTSVMLTEDRAEQNWSILALKSHVASSSWQFFRVWAGMRSGASSMTYPPIGHYWEAFNDISFAQGKNQQRLRDGPGNNGCISQPFRATPKGRRRARDQPDTTR